MVVWICPNYQIGQTHTHTHNRPFSGPNDVQNPTALPPRGAHRVMLMPAVHVLDNLLSLKHFCREIHVLHFLLETLFIRFVVFKISARI